MTHFPSELVDGRFRLAAIRRDQPLQPKAELVLAAITSYQFLVEIRRNRSTISFIFENQPTSLLAPGGIFVILSSASGRNTIERPSSWY
ncbi:hypothetical protein [Massilia haematophila]|uniref:Uncharacterized protein n=1 Tax=Massilia haematophila TaxID=457923 RepID=A0ABV7PHK1_9BURK